MNTETVPTDEACAGDRESALRLRTETLAKHMDWTYGQALDAISRMHGFRSVDEFDDVAPTTETEPDTAQDVFENSLSSSWAHISFTWMTT